MRDFHALWRKELLKDLRSKRSKAVLNLDTLQNIGSVYYDSHYAYVEMLSRAIRQIEEFPSTIGEYREMLHGINKEV